MIEQSRFDAFAHFDDLEQVRRRQRECDRCALVRKIDDIAVGFERAQRFTYGNPAKAELSGEFRLNERAAGRQFTALDLRAQNIGDLIRRAFDDRVPLCTRA